jgi:hypothetical protein
MKHHIAMKLIVFCALFLGMGQFNAPNTARASSSQIHTGSGTGIATFYRHHRRRRRRHHRWAVVIAPHIDIQGYDRDHYPLSQTSSNTNLF